MHSASTAPKRSTAVDALRGLVMIIMALDHTRDFFHIGAMSQSPTDLATTTPLLFATRWVTHICAPVFVLLAGASARLWLSKPGRTTAGLSRFLVTRGLWLIAIEIVVMRLAFDFSFGLGMPVLLLTLYALGGSMIVLAALIHLPQRVMLIGAAAVVLLHNLLDPIRLAPTEALAPLWTMLHQPGVILPGGPVVVVGYPLIPWFAVMALGYGLGEWLQRPAEFWRPRVLRVGLALIVAFLVVRALNLYGDPVPWTSQSSPVRTALSFLNVTKYPASLSFLLLTLGPALCLLSAFGTGSRPAASPLLVFGRVPLFYYVGHFFLLHLMLVAMMLVRYGADATPFLWLAVPSMGGDAARFPPGFGWDLGVIYLIWLTAVVSMYPLCRWFGRVRDRSAHGFVKYF